VCRLALLININVFSFLSKHGVNSPLIAVIELVFGTFGDTPEVSEDKRLLSGISGRNRCALLGTQTTLARHLQLGCSELGRARNLTFWPIFRPLVTSEVTGRTADMLKKTLPICMENIFAFGLIAVYKALNQFTLIDSMKPKQPRSMSRRLIFPSPSTITSLPRCFNFTLPSTAEKCRHPFTY